MHTFAFAFVAWATLVFAGDCGPQNGNHSCAGDECCSQYGWCGTTVNHCDAASCLYLFSGSSSPCGKPNPSDLQTGIAQAATSSAPPSFATNIPIIDVCGHAQGGVTCPGAGVNGYFYRCCSAAGHCGPKNDIQDQALYCGDGCQGGYGRCDDETAPQEPALQAGDAGAGQTCGPIVNKKCEGGMCCSGSNFCGTGDDFCGIANWCQKKWGRCD